MSRYDFESPGYGQGSGPEGYGRGGLMFPRLTPGVKVMLIACVAVQVVQLFSGGKLTPWLGLRLESFAIFPLLGLVHLGTYMFVHAYASLGHILMNMLVLYFFGTMVEEQIGTRRFVRLYLISGLVGGLFWLVFSAIAGHGDVPMVGASGACYGVLTYAACRNPNAQVIFIIVFVRLWWIAAGFGVIALYNVAIEVSGGFRGRVADAAHLGGVAWALVYWRYGYTFSRFGERIEARAAARRRQQSVDKAAKLDRLLAKINEVGMGGLSPAERRFLAKYSRDQRK